MRILTTIDISSITSTKNGYSGALFATIKNSVVSSNPDPSTGGRNGDTPDEIRQNALYAYSTQLRAVTKDDYIVRSLAMPADYGTVSKAYISQDFYNNPQQTTSYTQGFNPLSLDLYVLSYNSAKQLVTGSALLKNNLATYINQYRMLTDAVNIKNAYAVNIGII